MTTADEAGRVLDTVADAARKTRAARPTRALPLLVLGLVIVGAMPFYVLAEPQADQVYYPLFWSGPVGTAAGLWTMFYWLLALPLAYALIVWWYARAARRSGVKVNVLPLVVTGAVVFGLMLACTFLFKPAFPADFVVRGLTPLLTIAVGLLVWAVVERSKGLTAVALVFLGAAISACLYDFVNLLWFIPWSDTIAKLALLPNLAVCALVLLVSSGVYAAIERQDKPQS
jgi:hypothetical protein